MRYEVIASNGSVGGWFPIGCIVSAENIVAAGVSVEEALTNSWVKPVQEKAEKPAK